ncbi:MAG: D-alanyl-D-alanine carboxypeptidase [marine bacterium B5-7]|nr:MAG: D-alanyl-D-alanine carboxypeptidase [marine bacterium B5-7]
MRYILITLSFVLAPLVVFADVYVPENFRSAIPPPNLEATSWVLQDQKSGWIIAAKEPELQVEPASISKLMTAYIVFEALSKGTISKDDKVLISERAWKMEGSRMFVKVNSKVTVEDLLKGLIVQSGNDASVALAEYVAGSEDGFVELMNQTAQRLGLRGTHYVNTTGLPHADHYSTARDISELTRALIRDFPEDYSLYSIKEYTYNNITQQNRNVLLLRDEAVDGVKTGHTSTAGYCLVGSAEKEGMRLIATVMGTASKKYRADAVYSLLQYGFAAYEGFLVHDTDKPVASPTVYKGDVSEIDAMIDEPLYVTVAKGSAESVKARVSINNPLIAPIAKGDRIGALSVSIKGESVGDYPLVSDRAVESGSWIGNIYDSVLLLFQ